MREVVIASAARTPFGKFGGRLMNFQATDLGGLAIQAAVRRAGIQDEQIDEVIMGMVLAAGAGQVPARQAAFKAGIPDHVPAFTVNKVCGSALKAITLAVQIIKAGDADIIVAGGMESMSNAPYLIREVRWGSRMNNLNLIDAMISDGLWCPENNVHMATIGEGSASEYGISREDQDRWSLRSQMLWAKAEAAGRFADEVVSVKSKTKKGEASLDKDEAPRPDTTMAILQNLPPAFDPSGTITAGNAPGLGDGAAAIVVMSRDKAEALGIPILAVVKDYAQVAQPSRSIATVPGLAIQKILDRQNLSIHDIDLIEINEAFAAVPLVSSKILGLSADTLDAKVNVNGSAIAVGHPIGASGARILMTLLFELRRRDLVNGICAICSGMAQGDAIWIQNQL